MLVDQLLAACRPAKRRQRFFVNKDYAELSSHEAAAACLGIFNHDSLVMTSLPA